MINVAETLNELLEMTSYEAGLKERISRLRARLSDAARSRWEEEGAAPSWKRAGVGMASWLVPEPRPVVVDDTAWLAYVRDRSPDDVETLERVRPNILTAIVDRCDQRGDNLVDPETGEVVPGVEFRASAPHLLVKLDPEAKAAAVAQALDDLGEAS